MSGRKEAARLRAIERRLNDQAYPVICAELARLDAECEALRAENEDLRARLARAEECAEGWREDALDALEREADSKGGAVGLTMGGHLVVCDEAAVGAMEDLVVIGATATRLGAGDVRPGFFDDLWGGCLDAPQQFPSGSARYVDGGYDTGFCSSREVSGRCFVGGGA